MPRLASLLLAIALAAPAVAQPSADPPPSPSFRPTGVQRTLLVGGGVTGSVLLMSGTGGLSQSGWAVLAALPLGAALGVDATGRLLGLDGSFREALTGAVVGTAAGGLLAVGTAVVLAPLVTGDAGCDAFLCDDELAVLAIAAAVFVVTPAVGATIGYPRLARVSTTDGTPRIAPGAALRIGL